MKKQLYEEIIMNKKVLTTAIVLAMASGTAGAASFYSKDGVSVDVSGAAEVQLYKAHEFGKDKNDLDVRLDDGNLEFATSVKVNENLTALGMAEFDYESGDVTNSSLWVGLKTDKHQIYAGRGVTVYDDMGIDKSYEVGGQGIYGSVANGKVALGWDGDDVVRYNLDLGNFYAAVATDLKRTKNGVDDSSHVDGKIGFIAGDFEATAYAQQGKNFEIKLDKHTFIGDVKSHALELNYTLGDASFSGGFYDHSNEVANLSFGMQTLAFAADYKMGSTKIAGGFELISGTDLANKSDAQNVYVALTEQLHSNVKAYAEVGYLKIDSGASESSFAYTAGMEVKF